MAMRMNMRATCARRLRLWLCAIDISALWRLVAGWADAPTTSNNPHHVTSQITSPQPVPYPHVSLYFSGFGPLLVIVRIAEPYPFRNRVNTQLLGRLVGNCVNPRLALAGTVNFGWGLRRLRCLTSPWEIGARFY